jgi:Family of unknown function (DUF6325)
MAHGPLQVLVVNFDDANFTGEIEAELNRLEDAGTLRVLDVLVVAKSDDGEVEILRTGERHSGDLGQAVLGHADAEIDDQADAWYVADAIAPGGAAAIAVLDHQWAIPLREAIQRAGGHSVAAEWVDENELANLGVALPT